MSREFVAGVARSDITPPVGIAHATWGAQTHERAAGVDLPILTTALAFGDGETTAVIVDLEVVVLRGEEEVAAIRSAISDLTGIPTDRIRLAYTHTHSAAKTNRDTWYEGAEMVDDYLDLLAHKAAGTAWKAVNDLEPARISAGTGHSEIAVNRRFARPEDGRIIVGRNWEGPVDHEVGVVRIDTADGEPLAAIANYACHPIVVGPDNDLITPDYPGVVRRVVEESTDATCVFLQGAAGDVGPIHGVATNGVNEYKLLGRRLGHEVARVWWSLDTTRRQDRYVETLESGAPLAVYEYDTDSTPSGPVASASCEVELPVREFPDPDEVQTEYDEKTAELQDLREQDADPTVIQEQVMLCRRTEIQRRLAETFGGRSHATFELQAFAIGKELAVVGIAGEPFVRIGKQVKEHSPFEQTLFSGYSNAKTAYVPMPEDYEHGGYEVDTTPFTPEAAGVIVDETLGTLEELIDRVR